MIERSLNRTTTRAVDASAQVEPNNGFGRANPLPAGAPESGRLNGKVQLQLHFLNSTQRVAAFAAPPYAISETGAAGIDDVVIFTDPRVIDPAAAYVFSCARPR